jgi:hypothetical protein
VEKIKNSTEISQTKSVSENQESQEPPHEGGDSLSGKKGEEENNDIFITTRERIRQLRGHTDEELAEEKRKKNDEEVRERLEEEENNITYIEVQKRKSKIAAKRVIREIRKKKEMEEREILERKDFCLPVYTENFYLSLYGFMDVISALFVVIKECTFHSPELNESPLKETLLGLSPLSVVNDLKSSEKTPKSHKILESDNDPPSKQEEMTREEKIQMYENQLKQEKEDLIKRNSITQSPSASPTLLSSSVYNKRLPTHILMWNVSRFLFRVFDWDQDDKISGSDLFSVLSTLQPDIEDVDLYAIGYIYLFGYFTLPLLKFPIHFLGLIMMEMV